MRNAKCVVRNGGGGAIYIGYYSTDFCIQHSFSTAYHKVKKGYEKVIGKAYPFNNLL